jgi:uncharacterized protein
MSTLASAGLLIDCEKEEAIEVSYQFQQVMEQRNKLELTIVPTNACNLRCPYCYQRPPFGSMSDSSAEHIISFIEKNVTKYKSLVIGWFGGEPLLRKDVILKITAAAKQICRKNGIAFPDFDSSPKKPPKKPEETQ